MARSRFWVPDPQVWRRRAVRLLLVYLALTSLLLTGRYLTREVRPTLLATEEQVEQLTRERDVRDLRVQSLLAYARIQTWAQTNGMIRFAEAPKTSRDLGELPLPPDLPTTETPLKVNIQWN